MGYGAGVSKNGTGNFSSSVFLLQCMQCCKKQQYPGTKFLQSAIVTIAIFAHVGYYRKKQCALGIAAYQECFSEPPCIRQLVL